MRKIAAVLVGFVLAGSGIIVTGAPAQAGPYEGTINNTEYRKLDRQWRKYNHRREVERMANARGEIIWRDRDRRGRLDAIVVRYRTPKRRVVVQIAYIREHRRWRVNDFGKRRL